MALAADQYYKNQIKRSLTGKYRPHGDPSRADCVFGVGFGYREFDGKIIPSLSTRQIAAYLEPYEHLPKVLTHDLAAAYRKLVPQADDSLNELIYPEHLTALRVVNVFRDFMKTRNWHTAVLLGHPHHLPWLDYLCGQIQVMTAVPAGLQVAFDPVSVQPWTRDEQAWRNEINQRLQNGYDQTYKLETYRPHHS